MFVDYEANGADEPDEKFQTTMSTIIHKGPNRLHMEAWVATMTTATVTHVFLMFAHTCYFHVALLFMAALYDRDCHSIPYKHE